MQLSKTTQRKLKTLPKVAHACGGHSVSGRDSAPARALRLIKEAGLRSTQPRLTLIEAIVNFPAPFSADELHQSVRRSGLDLVTVYRTLSTFTELELLQKIDLGDGLQRYELRSDDGSHHHHFVCNLCHRIEPLDACEIASQERKLKDLGYGELTHRLEFFGICPDCRPKRRTRERTR